MSPRVCVGIPTYNGGRHIRTTLESLLGQSFRDVAYVLVDDASDDGTLDVARELAACDERLRVEVNESRVGMVGNWNRALDRAHEIAPDAEYFAWGSDHDHWAHGWLESLVAVLDAAPSAVLAYPRSNKFDEAGAQTDSAWAFDTARIASFPERLRLAARRMPAGDMIYGLFRLSALDQVAPFPAVIYPDRLLLARLTRTGRFIQVPEVLWFRRITAPSTPSRQRRTLFPAGKAPAHARLPWWLVHGRLLASDAGVREAIRYSAAGAWLAARSMPSRIRRRAAGRTEP